MPLYITIGRRVWRSSSLAEGESLGIINFTRQQRFPVELQIHSRTGNGKLPYDFTVLSKGVAEKRDR